MDSRTISWRDMRPRFYLTRKDIRRYDPLYIGLDGHFWAQFGRVVFTTSPK